MSFSNDDDDDDDDDRRLFYPHYYLDLSPTILRIKNNDAAVTNLYLQRRHFSERAWRHLGDIIGLNTHLEVLIIVFNGPLTSELLNGLQNNKSIERLKISHIGLQVAEKMLSLAPFLTNNPRLRSTTLQSCGLGASSVNILTAALLNRSEDTLETLNLGGNDFSDVDLDVIVQVLSRSRSLTKLSLGKCCIGLKGCTSLSALLRNQASNLTMLYLYGNSIDDKCAEVLARSLAKNTKLNTLSLAGNRGITTRGWTSILDLVCNSVSVTSINESNHTLNCLNMQQRKDLLVKALGDNDANLLYASLNMNYNDDKMVVVRHKMIWSHARRTLNLGESNIETAAMPLILGLIGNETGETGVPLAQYHDPPLPMTGFDTIRIDSLYCILRCRPDLCEKACGSLTYCSVQACTLQYK